MVYIAPRSLKESGQRYSRQDGQLKGDLHVWSKPQRSYILQVSSKSIHGFWSHNSRNLVITLLRLPRQLVLYRTSGDVFSWFNDCQSLISCRPIQFVGDAKLQPRMQVRKGINKQEQYLYSAFYILWISQSAQAWITQFYLQIHHACFSFVSVHQMAPHLTEVRDNQLQLTTHLSTPKG